MNIQTNEVKIIAKNTHEIVCTPGWNTPFFSCFVLAKCIAHPEGRPLCEPLLWPHSTVQIINERNMTSSDVTSNGILLRGPQFECPILAGFRLGLVSIALGYGLNDRGSRVRFQAGLGIFPFATVSRTALGLTQPPIQWVLGALSLGVKLLTTHLHLVSRSRTCGVIPPLPQYVFMA
jgi:hypothetical protein